MDACRGRGPARTTDASEVPDGWRLESITTQPGSKSVCQSH